MGGGGHRGGVHKHYIPALEHTGFGINILHYFSIPCVLRREESRGDAVASAGGGGPETHKTAGSTFFTLRACVRVKSRREGEPQAKIEPPS